MTKFAYVFSERELGTTADCGRKVTIERVGPNAAAAYVGVIPPTGFPYLYNIIQRRR